MPEQPSSPSPDEQLPAAPEHAPIERWHNHPILTREQEYTIFAALRNRAAEAEEYTVQELCQDTNLLSTIDLTSTASQELWVHALTQADTVRDLLVRCYDSYAWRMAFHFQGLPFPLEDKVASARMGIADAIDSFDPDRGVSFRTYAHFSVRSAMQGEMCNQYGITRTDWLRLSVIRRISGAFYRLYNRYPQREELTAQLIVNADGKEGRLYVPSNRRDEYIELHEALLQRLDASQDVQTSALQEDVDELPEDWQSDAPTSPSAEEAFLSQERSAAIGSALEGLSPQQYKLLTLVFGFDGNEMPLTEAAVEVGIPPMDAKAYLEETLASLRSEKSLQNLVGLKPAPTAPNEAAPSAPTEKRLFRLTQEDVSQMLAQYPPKSPMHQTVQLAWQGFSARKIAAMRGVTYQSVYELLRRFGAEQHVDVSLNPKLRSQYLAAEMYQANYTIKEISEATSVSPFTVKTYLIASGLLPAPATPQEQAERYAAAAQEPTIVPVSELLKRERQARRDRRAKSRKK